jgi:RNase P/RNase MRP subunit POP5
MKIRERQRYIMFKIIKDKQTTFTEGEFIRKLWDSVWRYFGMAASIKVGLWLLELNFESSYGIIRFSSNSKEIIISALGLIRHINNKRVILSPIKTSGTIKSIRKRIDEMIKN